MSTFEPLETVHRLVPWKSGREREKENRNQRGRYRRRDRQNIDQENKHGIAEYSAESEDRQWEKNGKRHRFAEDESSKLVTVSSFLTIRFGIWEWHFEIEFVIH